MIVIVNKHLGIPGDDRRSTTIHSIDDDMLDDWASNFGVFESRSDLADHHLLFYRAEDGSVTCVEYFGSLEGE